MSKYKKQKNKRKGESRDRGASLLSTFPIFSFAVSDPDWFLKFWGSAYFN